MKRGEKKLPPGNPKVLANLLAERKESPWSSPPDLSAPDVLVTLLNLLQESGSFVWLAYNRAAKRWVVQFETGRSGPYPSHPRNPAIPAAQAMLCIWQDKRK